MNLIGWKVVFYFDSISVENLSADSCLRKSGTYMLILKTAVFKGNFHTDSFKSEAILVTTLKLFSERTYGNWHIEFIAHQFDLLI